MIHFVNPHGGFMPYSTLSLAGTAMSQTLQTHFCMYIGTAKLPL